MKGSSPGHPDPAAAIVLDLAFQADPDPEPGTAAAGGSGDAALEPQEAAWEQRLALWLADLQADLPACLRHGSYSLGLSLVDDSAIAELNAAWRGKDGPTDVLAFAAQEPAAGMAPPPAAAGEPLELGDIVISLQTAARQAGEQGHSLERELLVLASHGLLHLLGWDHPDEASLTLMLARQEALIAALPAAAG